MPQFICFWIEAISKTSCKSISTRKMDPTQGCSSYSYRVARNLRLVCFHMVDYSALPSIAVWGIIKIVGKVKTLGWTRNIGRCSLGMSCVTPCNLRFLDHGTVKTQKYARHKFQRYCLTMSQNKCRPAEFCSGRTSKRTGETATPKEGGNCLVKISELKWPNSWKPFSRCLCQRFSTNEGPLSLQR